MKKKTIPQNDDATSFIDDVPFSSEPIETERKEGGRISMVIPSKSELRKSAHINLRILPKLKKDIESVAAEKGLTVSDLLTVMIQSVVSNREFKM